MDNKLLPDIEGGYKFETHFKILKINNEAMKKIGNCLIRYTI